MTFFSRNATRPYRAIPTAPTTSTVANIMSCRSEAHIDRISRREYSGTDARPDRVLTRMTKNAVDTATTILEEMPNPNQTMKIGASTTDGITWSTTTYG